MNKNDLFEISITDMGDGGEGIGHYEGMTFFIKDALIGDVILARATKLKKNYGYARVEEIISPSTFRIEARCKDHRRCGGCQIQALDYEKQLEFKNDKIRNNLMRIGGFSENCVDSAMLPIVGMENPYRYRNKAQFPVGYDKDGNIVMGFYATRSHNIIPVDDCLLGVEENRVILEAVKSWMEANGVSAYDETAGKGMVRHVLIRYGFTSREIMVCLIVNGRKIPAADALCQLLAEIQGMTSISYNINTENTNVILGKETVCLWGQPYITDSIHLRKCPEEVLLRDADFTSYTLDSQFPLTETGVSYRISPQSFYQVNPVQTEKLYSTALEFAGLTGRENVWDLYCGIGTISLFLSQKAKKVYGVEIVPQAIEDARNNARLNNISNTEFFVGKAEEVLPEFYEKKSGDTSSEDSQMLRPDVIVVDPPRKGCDEKCLDTMIKMSPERIVYVSCDSATLARDLKYLCANGYSLRKVQGFDQFGHTLHVETVVLLSQLRQKPDDYIDVDVDVAELEGTSAETKATYEKIKKNVAEHNDGMKVSNLYIAQVKRKCGLELAKNFNLPKSEDSRQPQCPKEKEEAIVEALKAFQMI